MLNNKLAASAISAIIAIGLCLLIYFLALRPSQTTPVGESNEHGSASTPISISRPVVAAGTQPTPQPQLASFFDALVERPDVAEWITSLGNDVITEKMDDAIFKSWKSKGVGLRIENARVAGVFLYADGYQDFKQFQGSPPFGLKLEHSRRDVEQLLGRPSAYGKTTAIPFWSYWHNLGVSITYRSSDPNDLDNQIGYILIRTQR